MLKNFENFAQTMQLNQNKIVFEEFFFPVIWGKSYLLYIHTQPVKIEKKNPILYRIIIYFLLIDAFVFFYKKKR